MIPRSATGAAPFAAAGVLLVAAFSPPPAAGQGRGTLTEDHLAALALEMTAAERISMVRGAFDDTCAAAVVSPSVQGCVGQAGYVPGVPRLGIPPLRMADGPAGAKMVHVATALPAPLSLAATFDEGAAVEFGALMAREARALNQDVLLAPMVNLITLPTAGRAFETLGEDPYLAARMAAAEVRGIQAEGVIATLKHLAMNQFENGRTRTSARVDPRTLMEMELPAFAAGVKAGAGAVMCAYNRVNDVYACSSEEVLQRLLRDLMGFDGWVVSDWGAADRSSDLIHGLDMAMPRGNGGNGWEAATLEGFLGQGSPAVPLSNDRPEVPAYPAERWQAALDRAVRAILRQMNRAGLLEGTIHGTRYAGGVPHVPPRPDLEAMREGHARVALELAQRGATLLKNEGTALPLGRRRVRGRVDLRGLAVIGPTAAVTYVGGQGSAGVRPFMPVQSPLEALKARTGKPGRVRYVPGYDLDGVVVSGKSLRAPDFSLPHPDWTLPPQDAGLSGLPGLLRQQVTSDAVPFGAQPLLASGGAPAVVDETVDHTGGGALPPGTAWRWTGHLEAPGAGDWELKVFVAGQSRAELFVDGLQEGDRVLRIGAWPEPPLQSLARLPQAARSHDPSLPDLQQETWAVTLVEGAELRLDLRVVGGTARPLEVQLRWMAPDRQEQAIAEAVEAAAAARRAVVFAHVEGREGRDRGGDDPAAGLALPGTQDRLIASVAAANPETIVVLNTGGPVLMPWIDEVRAVLVMWYPGQMGGRATADVLLGDACPGGKLPVTFPAVATHYPQHDPGCDDTSPGGNCPLYPGVASKGFLGASPHGYRTIDFESNGIFTGYRWHDREGIEPLFPFGHGLSCTSFQYEDLRVDPAAGGGLDVSFRLRNTGPAAGDEVAQIYLGPAPRLPRSLRQPPRTLVQFARVGLAPGESRDLRLHVEPRWLSVWSPGRGGWIIPPERREIMVGSSSRDIRLRGIATLRP